MTSEEQTAELGRMVEEHREIRQELECVNNKISRYAEAFKWAWHTLNEPDTRDWKTNGEFCVYDNRHRALAVPNPLDAASLLSRRRELSRRLRDLNKALDI